MLTKVTWGKIVDKQLDRIPDVITRKFRLWVALLEETGEVELIEVLEVNKHEY